MSRRERIEFSRAILNIDVRNKLRLGHRFHTEFIDGEWYVFSLTKAHRIWVADYDRHKGFVFHEITKEVRGL